MRWAASQSVVLALVAIAVAPVAEPRLLAGERYALVVGVHQYDKNQLRNLPYAESDAVAVADRLKSIGFRRVVLMTQTLGATESRLLPTAANVRDSISGFLDPKKWDNDDTAVIVLSGHGVQFRGQDASYFCPMDARLERRETLIDIEEIYRTLEKCPAAFKLVIADCCRNDPQSDSSRARAEVDLESVTRPQRAKPPGGVAAFYSCSAGEKAFESPELKKGVFTHFLLEGLSDPKADLDRDGKVDLDELVRFTKRNVTDYVSDQFGESTIQVPELVGKTRGIVPLVELAKIPPRPVDPPKPATPQKGGDRPKTITSATTGMKLVLIPAGEFLRGSPDSDKNASDDEKPQHRVRITKDFYLGMHEVTQGEWKAVMGTEPWKGRRWVVEGNKYPATQLTWNEADSFCRKLSELDDRIYRLPTEGEWEYACRSGKTTRYSFGDTDAKLSEYAWWGGFFDGNAKAEPYPHQVGLKKPNDFGLFDMHGNVREWCADWYDKKEYAKHSGQAVEDPQGPQIAYGRVLRGGSWYEGSWAARSATRYGAHPALWYGETHENVGFRVAAELSAK